MLTGTSRGASVIGWYARKYICKPPMPFPRQPAQSEAKAGNLLLLENVPLHHGDSPGTETDPRVRRISNRKLIHST